MAILATIVGLFTGLYVFIYTIDIDVDDDHFGRAMLTSLIKAIAAVTALYIAANFTIYNWTGNSRLSETKKDMTLAEATASYGLKSDTEYPFDIGNRITGTAGSTTTRGGYFYLHNTSSWSPASSLSVGFTANGKSYIFEIPMSHITFIQSEAAKPSMKVHMDYPCPLVNTPYVIHIAPARSALSMVGGRVKITTSRQRRQLSWTVNCLVLSRRRLASSVAPMLPSPFLPSSTICS